MEITVRAKGERLEMIVTDNGTGVPRTELEVVFFPEGPQLGRLTLLRRQLGELFGKSFKFGIDSEIGAGSTATLSIPLQIDPAASLEQRTGRSRIGGTSTTQALVGTDVL